MSETETESKPETLQFPRAAIWLATAMLVGFGGAVAYSVLDHPRAAAVETFSETTAAGDTHYYEVPLEKLAIPEPVLSWEGRSWAPINFEKVKTSDPEMLRVGTDEASGLTLYRRKADGAERFIKTDVGEYLQVQAR